VWHFGLSSGRHTDKLRGFALRVGSTGSPILSDAASSLECRIESSMETGDRTAYLAAVTGAVAAPDLVPLTMRRLREIAPADKLARMDELYARDAAIDAQLIEQFRT
jgi:flavin reductase (DIM6/NTAB) family NADH-FMN oxidoreductase RutF